ncbi:MAG TPA: anthrone oxygenase family protein [Polyangiaceae bacterium]|nr:anthrone oxygenase family protein [Polyangiaceae bacterium]
MMPRALFYLSLATTLGSGLIAGVFFAFSSFVMPALAKLPPAQGLAAMQSINVVVLNRSFLSVFVGTAALASLSTVLSLFGWSLPGSKLRIAGSVLYVVGTFLVTMACNVPLNEGIARLAPLSAEAAGVWSQYVPRWTAWNTVRALAALCAAAAWTLSLVQSASAD